MTRVVSRVKDLEARGWSFEAADASFELLLRREAHGSTSAPFALESYRVILEHRADGHTLAEATVRGQVAGERVIATAEGNGPVNALDAALRKALRPHFPWVDEVELADYKVRILDGQYGTGAITRVLIESAEGTRRWTTVGVDQNVVEASWLALMDAMAYAALRACA